jgi:hypothetical protein
MEGLRQVAIFFTTIYIPYFISSSVGCDAAYNDLEMLKTLHKFSKFDPVLAETALTVMGRHTLFLQEETVVFSLFSDKLSLDEKSALACKI